MLINNISENNILNSISTYISFSLRNRLVKLVRFISIWHYNSILLFLQSLARLGIIRLAKNANLHSRNDQNQPKYIIKSKYFNFMWKRRNCLSPKLTFNELRVGKIFVLVQSFCPVKDCHFNQVKLMSFFWSHKKGKKGLHWNENDHKQKTN